MKKITYILCFLGFVTSYAQVGIGTTDPKATLDIVASDQANPASDDGILVPRIDAFPATNPIVDQDAMIVYLTTLDGTNTPGFYYWNNATTTWLPFGGSKDAWELLGNAGTDDTVNFLGTIDNEELVFKTNNTEFARLTTKGQFELSDANSNIFIGKQAGENVTIGRRNIYLGNNAGLSSVFNRDNIAIGDGAASTNILGNNSIAIGTDALENSDESDFSIAIGSGALNNRSKSFYNVGVGHRTLSLRATGDRNTAIGADAGRTTSGSNSVFIGYSADEENDGGNNVVIGAEAGIQSLTAFEPTGRVLIGHQVWQSQPGNNVLAIENSSSITPLLYGEFDNDILRIGGQLQIGSSDDTTPGSVYAFPTTDGTSGQVLTTDGAGAVTWQNGGAASADADWYEEGTTTAPDDINDNMFTQGNVGIGNVTPTTNLHVTGTTVPAVTGGVFTLVSQNFEASAVGDVSDTSGSFPYENNASSGCLSEDGWRISTTDASTAVANSCTTCSGNRAIIDFSTTNTTGCQQDNTLVVGVFSPTQTAVDVQFNYGYDQFRAGDIFNVTLYNTSNPANSVQVLNLAPGADTFNATSSTTQTVIPGDNYEIRVRYRANYSYGVSVDNFLITETVTASAGSYVFRLEDGQQQDGYVLTSDANGNATWEAPTGSGGGTDDQNLTLTGNTLSIENGNSVTLSDDWKTTGNTGTNSATNFLGTNDNQPLVIRTNNIERTRITTKGQIEVLNTGKNTFIGQNAGNLTPIATNQFSVFIGDNAGQNHTGGSFNNFNTAVGSEAMSTSTNGGFNTALGARTLQRTTTGSYNTVVGQIAGQAITTGFNNTAIGQRSLYINTTGNDNTAVGQDALAILNGGNGNVGLGQAALAQLSGGSNNVAIGFEAGNSTTGVNNSSNSIYLGTNAGYDVRLSNALFINNSNLQTAPDTETPLIGGDFTAKRVGINVDISPLTNLTHTLTVNGSVKVETLMNLKPSNEPAAPEEGDVYYDSALKKVRVWTGATWENLN
ncbi:beta strand repeat-containing protein [Aurantibacter aestuarii]|uniref:Uncharacterized protein n=1 Tax=Aurantibacter aestuarii TaxID=1266046 RepID=A0A2T1N984_9FLAO|nr:hypothetical protein [Aurantibacter aestuarii]PSG88418.1 hypothetical protein C7H52_08945 [Aurantibacter aestuarii]